MDDSCDNVDDGEGKGTECVQTDGMVRSRDEIDVVELEVELKYVDKVAIVVAQVSRSEGKKVEGLTDFMLDFPLAVMVVKTEGQ